MNGLIDFDWQPRKNRELLGNCNLFLRDGERFCYDEFLISLVLASQNQNKDLGTVPPLS